MMLRDIAPLTPAQRRRRALWKRLLSWFSDTPREEHIFLRARRGARFRWHFPPSLFDNIQFYVLVRYPWMEMGINDSIQCAAGWYPLENGGPPQGELRWVYGAEGQAFLKTPERVAPFGMGGLA